MNGFERAVEEAASASAARLRAVGVVPEALAEFLPERRVLLVRRQATMRPLGEVWRLGRLLLSASRTAESGEAPRLLAAGRTTRAAVRPHPGNQSISREERRDIAAAALKGGYPEGTVVHFDATALPGDEEGLRALGPESPLGVHDGGRGPELRVRWRARAPLEGAPTLAEYLSERVSLLVDPPEGA